MRYQLRYIRIATNFRVRRPYVVRDQTLALVGTGAQIGSWCTRGEGCPTGFLDGLGWALR